MTRNTIVGILFLLLFVSPANARVTNPLIFIGELVFNGVKGAPLITDLNGKVASGILNNAAYNDANFTCTTTDQVITGVTIAAPPAGTYEISMAGDISSATSGIVATVHFESNAAATTHGQIKYMPFAGGTLTSGSQRVPFAKTITATLDGTNPLSVFCSTSTGTVTTANVSLTYKRLL